MNNLTSAPSRELAERGASAVADIAVPIEQAKAALRWASDLFDAGLVVASSMGDEVLVHLASEVVPGVDVLFIDTGYHFPETLGTADAFDAVRPINLITVTPLQTVAEQNESEGSELFSRDPDRCCALRKVEPLERGLAKYAAWVTGMRRVDAPTRTDIDLISWDTKRNMIKLNPLATWDDDLLAAYAQDNGVLLNPLRQLGFASIGCAPCTRAVQPGEDPRAGRWEGRAKTECGLHT